MKENISVWLRVKQEQLSGPLLSRFRVSSGLIIANIWSWAWIRKVHTHVSLSLTLLSAHLPSHTVNGGYSNWQEWGPCSSTCGQGFQERIRLCDNPEPANGGRSCSGPSIDSRKCHVGLCPGRIHLLFVRVHIKFYFDFLHLISCYTLTLLQQSIVSNIIPATRSVLMHYTVGL